MAIERERKKERITSVERVDIPFHVARRSWSVLCSSDGYSAEWWWDWGLCLSKRFDRRTATSSGQTRGLDLDRSVVWEFESVEETSMDWHNLCSPTKRRRRAFSIDRSVGLVFSSRGQVSLHSLLDLVDVVSTVDRTCPCRLPLPNHLHRPCRRRLTQTASRIEKRKRRRKQTNEHDDKRLMFLFSKEFFCKRKPRKRDTQQMQMITQATRIRKKEKFGLNRCCSSEEEVED
jgi:hypothetical protein